MEIDVILDSQGLFVEVTYEQLLNDVKDPDSLDVGRMSNTKVLRTVGSRDRGQTARWKWARQGREFPVGSDWFLVLSQSPHPQVNELKLTWVFLCPGSVATRPSTMKTMPNSLNRY